MDTEILYCIKEMNRQKQIMYNVGMYNVGVYC